MSRYIPANAEPRALYLVEIAARPTLPGWPCGETLNKGDAPLLSRRRPPFSRWAYPGCAVAIPVDFRMRENHFLGRASRQGQF
ncbi:hypothetical protein A1332_08350 [Methylomonas methanica]|uniref:Uncharacterized protein n=1 Tax=Methylomonas methanica TaxID=421 RepID=A0A177MRF9_METMH|nr:hypothetical protein A1332_08350 [Methylomonas methanica]